MPSFDVVSEVDHHELSNALDQANREIGTRYDFKGSNARIEQTDNQLTLEAESEFFRSSKWCPYSKRRCRNAASMSTVSSSAILSR
jgi:hypothetical protein